MDKKEQNQYENYLTRLKVKGTPDKVVKLASYREAI